MKNFKTKTSLLSTLIAGVLLLGGAGYYAQSKTMQSGAAQAVPDFKPEDINEGEIDDIGQLTLPEAKKRLNYLIADSADTLNRLQAMSNMKLNIVALTDPSAELQHEPLFEPYTSADAAKALAALGEGTMVFRERLTARGNTLYLNPGPVEEIVKRASPPEDARIERYDLQQIFFRDGTMEPYSALQANAVPGATDEVSSSDVYQHQLTSVKPVDHISVRMHYQTYPAVKTLTLDARHPEASGDDGERVQLIALSNKSAKLNIALPEEGQYVIQGLAPGDSKPLRVVGRSASTLPSEQQMAMFTAWYQELLNVQQHFSTYPTSQSLQDHLVSFGEQLQTRYDAQSQSQSQGQKKVSRQIEYHFEAAPQRIVVTLLGKTQESQTDLVMNSTTPLEGHYIAWNNQQSLVGFVDQQGKWLVKPRFINADYTGIDNVYRIVIPVKAAKKGDDKVQVRYYSFMPGSQDVKPLPFEKIEAKINDDLLLVEREINGPYGIYDINKHQFTLPMKYVSPQINGQILVARVGEKTYLSADTYGAFTLQGKTILPAQYAQVSQVDDYLYTESANNKSQDVFDLTGKKINPVGYNVIGHFINRQPLLVQQIKTGKYAFIDASGTLMTFSLPYEEVSQFSNGMAVVRQGDRYGAIDTQGKLTIPLEYKRLYSFQKNLAAAEVADEAGLVLIDRQNKRIKHLGSYNSMQVGENDNTARYSVDDPQHEGQSLVFDADGNPIENESTH